MYVANINVTKSDLKENYTVQELSELKAFYNLGRNRHHYNDEMITENVFSLNTGDDIYAITKHGLIKENFKNLENIGNNLRIKCEKYTFFARDFGYILFADIEGLDKRCMQLRGIRNKWLIKHQEFDWHKTKKLEEKANKHIMKYMKALDKLEAKYPVDGYFWSFEPNDQYITLEKNYDLLKLDEKIEKQRACSDGEHMLVKIQDDIYWCQNCGTLITGKFSGKLAKRHKYNKVDLFDVQYYYPLEPNFLPKKNKNTF